jgi:RNA polymerase sigma-70 factor, ECF subfamily
VQTSLIHNRTATYLCPEYNLHKVSQTSEQVEQLHFAGISNAMEFEQLFRKFYQQLCRYAFTILKDTDAAEEVVQEVFLKIWERRDNIEFTVSVKSYLYRAVHNASLNQNDKKKREVRMDEGTLKVVHPDSTPSQNIQSKELEKAIAAAMEKLPVECRRVFEMSRFGEMKYREIADALGISVKTVENQMGKALRVMREQLSEYLPLLFPFFLYHLFQMIPSL